MSESWNLAICPIGEPSDIADALVELTKRDRSGAIAHIIWALACGARNREAGKVMVTNTYTGAGVGCSERTASRARRKIAAVLGSEINKRGEITIDDRHVLYCAWACRTIAGAGKLRVPAICGGPNAREVQLRQIPRLGRSSMPCPFHADGKPSAYIVWHGAKGGGRCLSEGCGVKFAIYLRNGAMFAKESVKAGTGSKQIQPLYDSDYLPLVVNEASAVDLKATQTKHPARYLNATMLASGLMRRTGGSANVDARMRYSEGQLSSDSGLAMVGASARHESGVTDFYESIGKVVPHRWEWIERADGAKFMRVTEWRTVATERIVFDFDDLAIDGLWRPTAAQLSAIRDAVAPLGRADVLVTSAEGVQVHVWLPVDVAPTFAQDNAGRLRAIGARVQAIIGRGGHLDESVWRPGSLCRRPGWRWHPEDGSILVRRYATG